MSDQIKSMQSIRIGATEEQPYVFPCFVNYPKKCDKMGTDLEYIYNVLNGMLDLHIDFYNYSDLIDLRRALVTNEIDVIGNTLPLDRNNVMNETVLHTPPSNTLSIGFFTKFQPVTAHIDPFSTFDWDFWICISMFTILLVIIKKFFTKSTSVKLFFVLWSLVLTLITEMYGNLLTADLLTSKDIRTSFEDLADLGQKLVRRECRLVVYYKYVDIPEYQIIFNPHHEKVWAENFRLASRSNPPILISNKEDMYPLVRNSNCVVGLDFVGLDLSMYESLSDIVVKLFPEDIPFLYYAYYHKLAQFSTVMDTIFASESFRALPDALRKRYHSNMNMTKLKSMDEIFLLDVSKLYSCFMILIVGIVSSGAIAIWDNIELRKLFQTYKNWQKMKRKNFIIKL